MFQTQFSVLLVVVCWLNYPATEVLLLILLRSLLANLLRSHQLILRVCHRLIQPYSLFIYLQLIQPFSLLIYHQLIQLRSLPISRQQFPLPSLSHLQVINLHHRLRNSLYERLVQTHLINLQNVRAVNPLKSLSRSQVLSRFALQLEIRVDNLSVNHQEFRLDNLSVRQVYSP